MAKNVRWQVPFESINQTRYRIDIYDEDYTGEPVQLLAGATPFTTDEDNNDDYFAPVRPQTGKLNVIDTDGTLTAALIPQDNTSRPVKLIHHQSDEIVWQGYLSCEAYSQPFTDRPNEITINCNSVLAAMKSVKLTESYAGSLQFLYRVLWDMVKKMNAYGCEITQIGFPHAIFWTLNQMLNYSAFGDNKEICNETARFMRFDGNSYYDVLSSFCSLFGLTAREYKQALYLCPRKPERMDLAPFAMFELPFQRFLPGSVPLESVAMSALHYRGKAHEVNYTKGVRDVAVKLSPKNTSLNIGLPSVPAVLSGPYIVIMTTSTSAYRGNRHLYSFVNQNTDYNANIEFKFHSFRYRLTVDSKYKASNIGISYVSEDTALNSVTIATNGVSFPLMHDWQRALLDRSEGRHTNIDCTFQTSAIVGKYLFYNTDRKNKQGEDGLFITAFNSYTVDGTSPSAVPSLSEGRHVVKITSNDSLQFSSGWLNIDMSGEMITPGGVVNTKGSVMMTASLKWGNLYWDGTKWDYDFATFDLLWKDGALRSNYKVYESQTDVKTGIFLPNAAGNAGIIEFCIYPRLFGEIDGNAAGQTNNLPFACVLRTLSVKHVVPRDDYKTQSGQSNEYRTQTDMNFEGEKVIELDFGSSMDNDPSPSLILGTGNTPVSELTFIIDGQQVQRRPESVLLEKMAEYYGANRKRITLEVQNGDTGTTPICTVTQDDASFAPLAESRDYRTEKSTITLFELP